MMRRTTVDGKTLNLRTARMLDAAQKRLGFNLWVIQGSYNSGVGASAGTHDGGGALDVSPTSHPDRVVKALREVGFAAWHRLPSQGPWVEHIHAIAIGDPELSSGAAFQVSEYKAGRNGLANRQRDDGPRIHPIPVWPVTMDRVSLSGVIKSFTVKDPKPTNSVKRVQRMLNKRLGGTDLVIDGVAGPKTRAKFKAYQRHIGRKAITGVPGPLSLRRLVAGYYQVVV